MNNVPSLNVEPSEAPERVIASQTGARSIVVTWNPIPGPDQNGEITGYTVYYRAISGHTLYSDEQFLRVNASVTRVEVSSLEENVIYNVFVSANTSVGEGPRSKEVLVRTAQASKHQ